MMVFTACKKTSQQKLYYYEIYQIGQKYPTTSPPSDSIPYVDSTQTNYTSFQGDTVDRGPDDRFYLSGSFYKKRYQHFEVYRYTR